MKLWLPEERSRFGLTDIFNAELQNIKNGESLESLRAIEPRRLAPQKPGTTPMWGQSRFVAISP